MAGRIPQSFINTLLDRVDIVAVVGECVSLKRKGNSYWGCCPFHDEKSPSFHVLPERQFYKCFGCGVSGTALSFVMAYQHLDFVEAIERLASTCGLEVPREASANPAVDREREQLLAVTLAAAEYFQQSLAGAKGEAARAYLARRGISQDVIARFGLGYAPAGWDGLSNALKHFGVEVLERAGLIARNERGVYDRFRDRLMFPIRNGRGRIIGFGGRVLDAGEPKYLNSPESPVFQKGREVYGLQEARRGGLQSGQIVLVEGYMDVVGLAQHGVTNAVAALGTATSAHQLELLFKAGTELVCCFDADKAGDTAAWRALETALPVLTDDRRLSFVRLADGEDPDSLVKAHGVAAWQACIEQRQPFADFFFEQLSKGLTLARVDDRTALVQRAEPLLGRLPSGVRQRLMRDRLKELAKLTSGSRSGSFGQRGAPGAQYAAAAASDRRYAGYAGGAGQLNSAMSARRSFSRSISREVLALLVHAPTLADGVDLRWLSELDDWLDPALGLLAEVVTVIQQNPGGDLGYLLGHFHGHPQQAEIQRIVANPPELPQSEWQPAFLAGIQDLQRGRGRRVPSAAIDSDDALRAHFEAQQRRNLEQSEQSGV